MRKLLLYGYAVGALLSLAFFVDVAVAGVEGPDEFHGHGADQCEAPTHLAYYDPRRGHTVFDQDAPEGDNTYYVDDDPLLGFQPDGNYPPGNSPDADDCQGTPVLRWTAYAGVTVIGASEPPPQDQHFGYPACGSPRNPYCPGDKTGARAAFYVATPNQSTEVGYSAGVTLP